ncbi:MAG: hypothetical protein HRU41_29120 [Saprospiraceae bacterium]|nr:hypothetical protein [Saprospiraceae bacterium]
MHRKIAVVCLVLFFGITGGLSAQNAAKSTAKTDKKVSALLSKTSTPTQEQDWTIFHDDENDIYYIDFETIKVNISDVVIRDESNKIIYEEDVFDLPVNTIYELDMKAYKAGKYRIELRTFTDIIAKNIELK